MKGSYFFIYKSQKRLLLLLNIRFLLTFMCALVKFFDSNIYCKLAVDCGWTQKNAEKRKEKSLFIQSGLVWTYFGLFLSLNIYLMFRSPHHKTKTEISLQDTMKHLKWVMNGTEKGFKKVNCQSRSNANVVKPHDVYKFLRKFSKSKNIRQLLYARRIKNSAHKKLNDHDMLQANQANLKAPPVTQTIFV